MANFTKQEVVKNFSWRYLGRFGSQIISFVVTIILARLLTPDAFGAVAIVSIFTNFLQVFVDSGLGTALVQKKNAEKDGVVTVKVKIVCDLDAVNVEKTITKTFEITKLIDSLGFSIADKQTLAVGGKLTVGKNQIMISLLMN